LSKLLSSSLASGIGLNRLLATGSEEPAHPRFPPTFSFPFAFAFSYLCLPLIYWRRICPVAQSSSNFARYGSASLAFLMLAHDTPLAIALTAITSFANLVIDWSL
jgi:hypothetical protein